MSECVCQPLGGQHVTGCPLRTPFTIPATTLLEEGIKRQEALVMEVLTVHRRLTNTRGCTGCDWRSTAPGRNGDPDTMRHRHAQFNEHLTHAIVAALTSS